MEFCSFDRDFPPIRFIHDKVNFSYQSECVPWGSLGVGIIQVLGLNNISSYILESTGIYAKVQEF